MSATTTTHDGGQNATTGAGSPTDRRIGRRRGDRVVGASRDARLAIDQALAAARSDLPVLVCGPAGVGKRFLARAVHAWGARTEGPFVERACGALPEALQGREVFGCAPNVHGAVPGEYSGGLAEAARGTLLLTDADSLRDEVARNLLAALTQGHFTREGEEVGQPLRARVVVTSRGSNGSIFGDVPHHRITISPLAERNEDILPLAAHFLAECAEEQGDPPVGFTEDAREALLGQRWPGNARELRERVRQAVRLAGGAAVSAEALMLSSEGEAIPSFKEAKRAFETRYVEGLLRRCKGNISRAARLAKKDRKDFYDVIRRTGVDPQQFRG
ncbi:MAG: sigma-54-dependent Fis family transcriptional regulator [Deltaproteobacteria bacterium]|nr:sigma-54-dependent Fis family transcriptional regulator [Deltaproteobacteria bacterium]MBW2372591.1 sigma-54-dependent Fis family transcriptional regulator [Deltaproteobacteria bacterium]